MQKKQRLKLWFTCVPNRKIVPNVEMGNDVTTSFIIPVLSECDAFIRQELNSHVVTTKAQL